MFFDIFDAIWAQFGHSWASGKVSPIMSVELTNGQSSDWDLASLKAEINKLEQKSLLKYSTFVLIAGLILMFLGFLLKKS